MIQLGDTAGSICKIDMPTAEIDPGPISTPEEGVSRVSLSGVALGSSGEDEVSLVMT